MRSRPRIALFHPSLIHGGIQRVFANLAQGFLDRGFAVDMVQVTPEGDFRDQLPYGVRIVDLNADRALTSVLPLASYLRHERPNAVISGAIQTNIAAVWARRLAGVSTQLMLTEHNIVSVIAENAPMFRTRITPFFVRRFYGWADKLVAVSEGVAKDLASIMAVPIESIHVIYNPVIGREFWRRSSETLNNHEFSVDLRPTVLAVGRLHYHKDYPTLLRAFAEVRKGVNARLVFLGDGEERDHLAAAAVQLGIESSVTFAGAVANPLPYMRSAHVLALSSIVETGPMVLIEALAVGLPVVATDCPSGPREILSDGMYGTLVPVGDSPALAAALLKVLTAPRPDPVPRGALERFEQETAIRKYLELIGFEDYDQAELMAMTKVEEK